MPALTQWLEPEEQEKLAILQTLESGTQTVQALSQQLSRSPATILSRLHGLQRELQSIPSLTEALVITTTTDTWVRATTPLALALELRRIYVKRSLTMTLFISAAFDSQTTVPQFCLTQHISKSTFWRELQRLNGRLRPYNLQVSTKAGIHVVGDELALRLLMATLMTYFQGDRAMSTITPDQLAQADQVLTALPDEVYPSHDYKRRNFFTLLLVISRRRISQHHTLSVAFSVPLYPNSPTINSLQHYLMARDHPTEGQFLCSFFLAFAPYNSQQRAPQTQWLAATSSGRQLLARHQQWVTRFQHLLPVVMPPDERRRFSLATLLTQYRTLLIPSMAALRALALTVAPIDSFQHVPALLTATFNPTHASFTPANLFDERRFYLLPALLEATVSTIDITSYYPQISLMLISNSHSQIQRRLLQVHGFFSQFNLHIANQNTEQVDIILADLAIPRLVQEHHAHSQLIYWHAVPTTADLAQLKVVLTTLTAQRSQ